VTHLVIETFIRAPLEVCFDAARDVDAHAKSAAFSGERVIGPGRLSGLLERGDLVTFESRHFGIRQRFTTRITELDRPRVFVDEMVRGGFKRLRHVHEFQERDGGTLMRDVLDWQAHLGFIADPLFLTRHMRWFVETKQGALKAALESDTKKEDRQNCLSSIDT
jgi:ligand-binding SRPBCC domain-containing protein